MARAGRTLGTWRCQFDTGGRQDADGAVEWVEAHSDELSVDVHVLDPSVRCEERAEAGLIHSGHHKVLVPGGPFEQLVADCTADDVGVDRERAYV